MTTWTLSFELRTDPDLSTSLSTTAVATLVSADAPDCISGGFTAYGAGTGVSWLPCSLDVTGRVSANQQGLYATFAYSSGWSTSYFRRFRLQSSDGYDSWGEYPRGYSYYPVRDGVAYGTGVELGAQGAGPAEQYNVQTSAFVNDPSNKVVVYFPTTPAPVAPSATYLLQFDVGTADANASRGRAALNVKLNGTTLAVAYSPFDLQSGVVQWLTNYYDVSGIYVPSGVNHLEMWVNDWSGGTGYDDYAHVRYLKLTAGSSVRYGEYPQGVDYGSSVYTASGTSGGLGTAGKYLAGNGDSPNPPYQWDATAGAYTATPAATGLSADGHLHIYFSIPIGRWTVGSVGF